MPLKGAMSAQSVLQWVVTKKRELLGGTEENIVPPRRFHVFSLLGKSTIFYLIGPLNTGPLIACALLDTLSIV